LTRLSEESRVESSRSKSMILSELESEENRIDERNVEKAKFVLKSMVEMSKAAIRFLTVLNDDKPNINDLYKELSLFWKKRHSMFTTWNAHISIAANSHELTEKYGLLQKFVLQNARLGDKLLKDAKHYKESAKTFDLVAKTSDFKSISDIICSSPEPLLIAKYENNDIIIEQCNQAFCSLLRYKKFEMMEKSIDN
jgi:PAS domain